MVVPASPFVAAVSFAVGVFENISLHINMSNYNESEHDIFTIKFE